MFKIALKYGLIAALVSVLVAVISYATGYAMVTMFWLNGLIQLAVFVFTIILAIRAVKEYRKELNRTISFTEAFSPGIVTFLIMITISALFNLLLFNVIDKEYADKVKIATIESMQEKFEKYPVEQERVDEAIEMMESRDFSYTPKKAIKFFGISVLFYSLISVIIAAAVKKDMYEVPIE